MSFFFHSLACPRIFDLTCPHWGPASTLCRRNMERHEPVRACVHPPVEDERAATNQGEGGGSGEVRENRDFHGGNAFRSELCAGRINAPGFRVSRRGKRREIHVSGFNRDSFFPSLYYYYYYCCYYYQGIYNNGLFVRFHCCCKNSSSSSREETVWLVLVSKIIPIFRVPFLGPKFPRNGSVTRHANNGRIYGRRGRVGDKGGRGNGGNGD